MNHQRLLEHFAAKILSLRFDGIEKNDIQMPNERWTRKDRALWFEISVGEGEAINHAEEVDRRLITVNVVCCVPAGSGTKRLNNIAEKVSRIYSPLVAKRAAFAIGENVIYIRRVNKMPVESLSDGVKLNVRFILDKYTKEY